MMDFDASEKNFSILVAIAAFIIFCAAWTAITWQPPIEARLRALRTRRVKARSDQPVLNKPSTAKSSIGFMRKVADRSQIFPVFHELFSGGRERAA